MSLDVAVAAAVRMALDAINDEEVTADEYDVVTERHPTDPSAVIYARHNPGTDEPWDEMWWRVTEVEVRLTSQ